MMMAFSPLMPNQFDCLGSAPTFKQRCDVDNEDRCDLKRQWVVLGHFNELIKIGWDGHKT